VATLHIENFPAGLYRLLEKLAAAEGLTLSALLSRVVHEHLYGFPVGADPDKDPFLPAAPSPSRGCAVLPMPAAGNGQAEAPETLMNTRAQRA
jgi:hypothetical protein